MVPEKAVVFCATQRTGSSLVFSDFLSIAGHVPRSSEMLYDRIIVKKTEREWSEVWKEVSTLKNVQGAYVEKVMFHYTPILSRFIEGRSIEGVDRSMSFKPELFDGFFNFFVNATWVYIERRDVFSQAVSMYIAETNNVWQLLRDRPSAQEASTAEPKYDLKRLKGYLSGFLTERSQWQKFFSHYNVKPISVFYEEAVDNYPAYLDEIFAKTGIEKVVPDPPRRFMKQGTDLNESWASQLRDDILAELFFQGVPKS